MLNNSKNNIISLIVKSLILSICGFFFPVLYLFIPAMFVVESVYSGIIKIFSFFIGICVLIGLMLAPDMGMMLFILFGPLILIFHYMITNKHNVNITILVTSIVFFISLVVALHWIGFTAESLNSPETIQKFIDIEKNIMGNIEGGINISDGDLKQIYYATILVIPSVLIITSLIVSYCTYLLTGRAVLKRGGIIIQPSSFVFFRLPKGLPIALIISIVLVYFLKGYMGNMYAATISNIFIVFEFILFVQGFSVLMYGLNKIKFGKILKFLIYISVFLIPNFQKVLILLGALDYLFNFRKLPN